MSQRGDEFDCKAYIHGRFKLQEGEQFADKEAFHYIHMNRNERRAHEAVYEKAKFKFKRDYLHVCKPNIMSHVQEFKYPYEQIEKVFQFKEYPTIIAFCINKKNNWIALLFETADHTDAERACRKVEAFHREKKGNVAGDKIGRGIGLNRPTSYIDPSDGDSSRGSRPPTVLYNGRPDSDSDNDFPEDIESPKLRPRNSQKSVDRARPVTYTEGVGPSVAPKLLLDVSYDHSPVQSLRPQNGHTRSKSPHRHDKKTKTNSYKVRVLGRFSSPTQETFMPSKAYFHLRNCMSLPRNATNPGDLRLMSDCMKLSALKNGHYDYHQLYRLMVFEEDPKTLVFGIVEKNRPMYMLLRFEAPRDRDQAVTLLKQYMGPGRSTDSADHHLSGLVTGNSYTVRSNHSGGSLEQMSRTIALPSEQEVVTKQRRRVSSSSSRTSSVSEAQEEIIAQVRRAGVQSERRRSSTPPGHMSINEEFSLLLASTRIEAEQSDNTRYIDAIVVEDYCADRTADSMYFGEEEEEEIVQTVSTRSHRILSRKSSSSSHNESRMKWVEDGSYIDYKPGVGMIESDSGPIYMYCARQVRENDYRLF